jgi:polar amino acid transport system substrate-binding protein
MDLRVAVALGPAVSPTFAVRDVATGHVRGVTVDLGAELARALDMPVRYVVYASSGAITAAAASDEWDVTFVPVDAERRKALDFGAAYHVFDSTYLVHADSWHERCVDLDTAGTRVAAIANTTTARRAAATLEHAQLATYDSVDALRDSMAAREVDAIALSRSALEALAALLPGTRVLGDAFHTTAVAVAVPRGRAENLTRLSELVEAAKASGMLRRSFDRAGLTDAILAPWSA